MRNVGDLVISRARLADTLSRVESHIPAGEWRAIQENAIAIDRQLRTLREGIMRVRLVPVGEIFRRMPFVVRDLARETGKRVRMELPGQSTEIDKFLIERMMDPGAAPGAQRGQPRHRDRRRAHRRRQAARRHDRALGAPPPATSSHRHRGRRPRRRSGGGGRARAGGGAAGAAGRDRCRHAAVADLRAGIFDQRRVRPRQRPRRRA